IRRLHTGQLHTKDFPELPPPGGLYLLHIHHPPQFLLQGRDLLVLDPAGNDISEITQVRIHIQRKTMHRDPPAAPPPDRADLTLPAPDTHLYPDTRLTRRPLAADT